MMAEYYDHYHRWEPLAEFHFVINDENDDEYDDENYYYCLCSRAFIRDAVKTYYAEKEDASESEVEVLRESQSQEWEDQSHVHFSLDTSYKVKCEKDEGASCYCSASHTDNYCSTDEHDPAQIQGTISHALQPSDSGADLTYQDCHSDYTTHDKLEKMDQDSPLQTIEDFDENYLSEETWEKFWAINGERLIWASWIKKYSDYINPAYLDENNDLVMDDNNIPKQHSADQIYNNDQVDMNQKLIDDDENLRERKFSYDSKVNPYKKSHKSQNSTDKSDVENKDDTWLPLARKRSCSEHDRILSPRTIAGTDSMTNVTKITLSSYDVTSSHVTSESTPTDDYSMSSSSSDDQNDQTRIANVDENVDQAPSEEMDTEQYWQFLWKKHFGEQYALHYANYVQSEKSKGEQKDLPSINIDSVPEQTQKPEEKALDIECENSEGNSQEMPTVIEVQAQVDNIKLDDEKPVAKPKKKNKKNSNRIIGSVGMLLQNLLKEEQKKSELNENKDVVEAGELETDKSEPLPTDVVDGTKNSANVRKPATESTCPSYNYDEGDEDPPHEKPVSLKRSHEVDEEEESSEKIKSTFEIMGFSIDRDKMPKGKLMYRKRIGRLRPPRYKRSWVSRKTYFDDDGNPYQPQESNDEREMQTDEDCADVNSETERSELPNTNTTDVTNTVLEQSKPIDNHNQETKEMKTEEGRVPIDMESSVNSGQGDDEEKVVDARIEGTVNAVDSTKRRRRQKRRQTGDAGYDSELPDELKGEPKMLKYWKKRHSLFHRFDEGIKLDRESWFSVTPESVAWHIANKFAYDVVLDAFCGAGGNTIQFARTCSKVIAIDIDPVKIEMARHNAGVYGVADRVEFIVGDFFALAPQLQADMVFLSPPWGGPKYSENYEYDLETMLEPKPASELMAVARTISPNIALYVPRNTKSDQLLSLAKEMGGSLEVEQSYLDRRFVAITAYFY